MRPHLPALLIAAAALTLPAQTTQNAAPHLEPRGPNTQLIVDGRLFVMLSGELLNSSLDYMEPISPASPPKASTLSSCSISAR